MRHYNDCLAFRCIRSRNIHDVMSVLHVRTSYEISLIARNTPLSWRRHTALSDKNLHGMTFLLSLSLSPRSSGMVYPRRRNSIRLDAEVNWRGLSKAAVPHWSSREGALSVSLRATSSICYAWARSSRAIFPPTSAHVCIPRARGHTT